MRADFVLVATVLVAACGGGSNDDAADGAIDGGAGDAGHDADVGGSDGPIFDAVDDGRPPDLPTGKLAITFWCGIPQAFLAKAAFDDLAAAHFTIATNACDGATFGPTYDESMLDLAHAAGLDAIVIDTRISDALAGTSVATNLDAVVKDYASSSGLYGYFLVDEPSASAFSSIASVVTGLHARDSAHVAYVNLLPNYATSGQLGTPTYDDYVAQFLDVVKPQVFSWDHYNFLSDGTDGGQFFSNLATVRAHALATGTPFWQIIQSIA